MHCPFMVHLLKKLDEVRAEQCNSRGNDDVHGKRQQLHAFEALLDRHEQTCPVCRQMNPNGSRFVENSIRRA